MDKLGSRTCPKCECFVDADKYCRPLNKTCNYCGYEFLTPKEFEDKFGKDLGLDEVINRINKALFKFEQFSKGAITEYEYIDMNDLFTQLFIEARKNYTLENCQLIGEYWKLLEQYRFDYDKGEFKSETAYKNEAFIKNCNEINKLAWDRVEDFCEFSLDDEFEEKKISILDLLSDTQKNKKPETTNKHFENSEWLEQKVLEFEAKGESQNKALDLTRELYESEFGFKAPGKTTILRYMGRAK